MEYLKYPSKEEVAEYCQSCGIEVPDKYPVSIFLNGLIREFEQITGWKSFLSNNKETTYRFQVSEKNDHYDSIIEFHTGLLEIKYLIDDDGVMYKDDKYWMLYPEKNIESNKPYEWIQIQKNILYRKKRISICGIWGYALSLPEDVWMGMLKKCSVELLRIQLHKISKGLKSWTQFGVTETFGLKYYTELLEQWKEDYRLLVERYKRVTYQF